MNKIILKTALGTLASLAVAALLVFSLWILISPQTMASSCEKTGNYSFAITCADLRYNYTDDVSDLSRCAQDSIWAGKDKQIVKYCEKLVTDEGFEEFCKVQDAYFSETEYAAYTKGYRSYIYGNLAAAQYRLGSIDTALQTAKQGRSFNSLIIEIIENGDKDTGLKVLEIYRDFDGSDANLTRILMNFLIN